MDWHALLGLPLPMAQEKRRQAQEGTPRVVRATPGRLTVCFFPDGDPGETE